MRISRAGGGSRSVVRVEGGRGENRQVILVGTELLRFPRVWEVFGVHLGVAEHLLELGVVERAVDGGVDVFPRWGEGRLGQWQGTGLGGGPIGWEGELG